MPRQTSSLTRSWGVQTRPRMKLYSKPLSKRASKGGASPHSASRACDCASWSRSMRMSVLLPYARRRMASSSICSSDFPGTFLTILRSCPDFQSCSLGKPTFMKPTVLVMPSLNLTISIVPSECSHSSRRLKTRAKADLSDKSLL